MSSPRSYEGKCHCGAIGFVFRTALEPGQWPIRACQCTFCRLHGALSTSDPAGSLAFKEHVPSSLQRYQFGRRTADFWVCRNCGGYVGATMESGTQHFGIINVRVLHELLDGLPAPAPMHYDSEGTPERLARREQRWTPVTSA